jgi:hypothetical protein
MLELVVDNAAPGPTLDEADRHQNNHGLDVTLGNFSCLLSTSCPPDQNFTIGSSLKSGAGSLDSTKT